MRIFAAVILSLGILAQVDARDPRWGGLAAVAVSPDGKTIAVGGQNRVLYLLDAENLKVKERIWVGARVGHLAFNKNGKRLLIEDDEESLHFVDMETNMIVHVIKKRGYISTSHDANLMAADSGAWREITLLFLSLTNGDEKGKVVLPGRWAAFALDAAGKRLAVLSQQEKSDKEKKVEWSKIPKELKGAARKEFVQKNDGYISTLTIYEVPSGKELAKHDLWYSSRKDTTELILTDDAVYSINYDNACAKIDDKGEVTMFEVETGYNYGIGVSGDRKAFLAGGLRDAAYVTLDGLKTVKLKLDRIPGWPEYFERFTFTPDGTGYGVTSAFRLIKISKEGKVEKMVPVY